MFVYGLGQPRARTIALILAKLRPFKLHEKACTMKAHLTLFALFASALLAFLCNTRAWAHGDEPHNDEATPTAQNAVIPHAPITRAATQSEAFEWVAWLDTTAEGNVRLWISLNDFASNQPLNPTQLEVTLDGHPLSLQPSGQGLYFSPLKTLPKSALALTLSLETPSASDLLALSLPAPATAVAVHTHPYRPYYGWAATLLTGLLLVGLGRGFFKKTGAHT